MGKQSQQHSMLGDLNCAPKDFLNEDSVRAYAKTLRLFVGVIRGLGAAKSSYGHAETAAGATGLLRASYTIKEGIQKEIMHLRTLNPYVANVFESQNKMQADRTGKSPVPCLRIQTFIGVHMLSWRSALLKEDRP